MPLFNPADIAAHAALPDIHHTRNKNKVIGATRVLDAVSGDVAYAGVGFQPTSIIGFAVLYGTCVGNLSLCDSILVEKVVVHGLDGDTGKSHRYDDKIFSITSGAGVGQSAIVKQFDADGFTLTWTKLGAPASTNVYLIFWCSN